MAEPEFITNMKFNCLSPITVSAKHEHRGKEATYYIRPGDPQLGAAIRKNLAQKFQTIYQQTPDDDQLTFSLDEDYIQRKGGYDRISKLITIKEGEEAETQIKCFIAPFALQGSIELMRVAYECGIGEKTSQGFGMIEVRG